MADDHALDDAVKCAISTRGEALLQWDFVNIGRGIVHPRRSVQMPESVVDLILHWRDIHQNIKGDNNEH